MNTANNIQYKGLNGPPTDNEDEDYPPQFTTLLHEQEKSEFFFLFLSLKMIISR